MGQSILYCRKCGAKLTPDQFKGGDAILLDGRPLCVGCVDTPVPAKPPPAPTPRRISAQSPPQYRPPTAPRIPAKSSRLPLVVGLAVAAGGAAIAALIFAGGGPPTPPAPRPAGRAPARAPESPKEAAAPAPAPDKPGEAANPPPATEMEKELDALEARKAEACGKEEFAQAISVLEEARNRRTEVSWVQAVEAKILQARSAAVQLLGPLKEKARDARRRGAADEVRSVVDRVSKWGLRDLSAELDRALEEASPPGGPAAAANPVEAALYLRRWEEAMYIAADRDYTAAIKAIEEASEKLNDKKLQGDAAGDMEILRLVRGLVEEADRLFSKSPKGQKVAVEVFDMDGNRKPVEGTVSRTGPGWIEVKGEKDSAVVDFGDLAGKTVADLFRSRPDKRDGDARLAALFLLIEGDPEGAKAAGGEGIPEAFWNHAKRRATIRPAPGQVEREAQAAFRSLLDPQRGWPEGQRRGGTPARGQALLEKYGHTACARRNRAAIARLMEPAKEYLFAASDLKGSGTFRLISQPKIGKAWAVSEGVSGIAGKENFVELEFGALPETNYRGWIYAGGCCAEVFVFYWQGTDLREPPQKGGNPVEMEPGANHSLPLRHSVTGLPRLHAGHPSGPEAVRWVWLPVPLPKYPSAGPKKVRILAEAQGALVAWAVISSARATPPPESRLHDIEKEEAEEAGKPEKGPRTGIGAGLVAHWAFDEGAGASSADANGRGFAGGLRNGAAWGPGRSGTAVSFDGTDDFFEVPETAELEPAQITVAAWFCPDELRSSGNTRDWLVSKGRNEQADGHYALALDTKEKQPIAYVNLGGGKDDCIEVRGPANSVAVGGWYHMALTYDGAVLKLYFNGALAGARAANKPRKPGKGPLVMGKRGDDWSKFKGKIDDVWLYSRALAAADIHAVIRAAGARSK